MVFEANRDNKVNPFLFEIKSLQVTDLSGRKYLKDAKSELQKIAENKLSTFGKANEQTFNEAINNDSDSKKSETESQEIREKYGNRDNKKREVWKQRQ